MTNAILTRETALKIRTIWESMHRRCYCPAELLRKPTYVGCTVHEDWHNLSNFKSWVLQQDYLGKSLDKDILVFDNKVYSEETCIFVTSALNVQLRAIPDRALPLGVWAAKGMFRSQIRAHGEYVSLGSYKTPYEAHRMWQVAKSEYLANYPLDDESPSVRPRLRVALDYRAQRIRDDLLNRRITVRP